MFKNQSAFTLIEVMLTLVLLAIIVTVLSSVFLNNVGIIKISKDKTDALNTVQNQINDSILANSGISQNLTLTFNKDQIDELTIDIEGMLISKTVSYTRPNGSTSNITLEYFEVVVQ